MIEYKRVRVTNDDAFDALEVLATQEAQAGWEVVAIEAIYGGRSATLRRLTETKPAVTVPETPPQAPQKRTQRSTK